MGATQIPVDDIIDVWRDMSKRERYEGREWRADMLKSIFSQDNGSTGAGQGGSRAGGLGGGEGGGTVSAAARATEKAAPTVAQRASTPMSSLT
jgi:hypothetical protein